MMILVGYLLIGFTLAALSVRLRKKQPPWDIFFMTFFLTMVGWPAILIWLFLEKDNDL